MVVVGLIVVALGALVLASCAAGLGQANPTHRLPGRLVAVAATGLALGGPMVRHNRRLDR